VSKARDADGVLMPYHLVHGHVVDAADASQRSLQPLHLAVRWFCFLQHEHDLGA